MLLDGLDGLTGGDSPHQLHPGGHARRRVVKKLDGPRHVGLAVDQALLLKRLEMAHHAIGALDVEVDADLPDRRPVAPALNLAADELVNVALPGRQQIQVGHELAPSLVDVYVVLETFVCVLDCRARTDDH